MSKRTATQNIESWFVDLDYILNNRMETLTLKFAARSPAVVAGYKNARTLVDSGGGGGQHKPTPPPAPNP